jgi:hypothetical protein
MKTLNYYVIDSSSLIELNRRYPIDVFPTLWDNVENLIKKGMLLSHKEVLKEINRKDDSLYKWALKQKNFFKKITQCQVNIVKEILAKYPSLSKSENETAAADPFVIALAIELGQDKQITLKPKKRIIVTEEQLRGNKVRIPFVCKDYGIECINIIEMCRIEEWKF